MPEPLEQQAVVVAGTGEDGVDATTVAPLEEVSTEAAVGLGVADDGLDGGSPSEFLLDGGREAALLA